jgi:adenylate cyclase
MRTFEEIAEDVYKANNINDTEALRRCAAELQQIATPQSLAMAHGSLGWATYLEGNYDDALQHYHQAVVYYEELGDQLNVARMIGTIGNVYDKTGDFAAALELYHRALAVHEDLDDRHGAARSISNIGIVHYNTGDYPAALEQYHRALDIYEALNDSGGAGSTMHNIGATYNKISDNTSALDYFQRALAIAQERGSTSSVASTLGNIGNTYTNMGDHSEALTYYLRALVLLTELGARFGIAGTTCNIVNAYLEIGSVADAQTHFELLDAMQIDEPNVRAAREFHRATLQERRGDMEGAATTLQAALAEVVKYGLRSETADIHKALRDLALKRNDLQSYVEHNNALTRITDEINGKTTATKLAMQAKQREIDAVRKETEKHLAVLHSTLPKHIADRVARGEQVNDHYDNAAVIFVDIVGFTTLSDQLSSNEVVQLLGSVFTSLDAVCKKHDVVKIKTIGDSYMAVAFPSESTSSEQQAASVAQRAANAALKMLDAASKPIIEFLPDLPEGLHATLPEGIRVRLGVHSGAVTAGVLGKERLQYDVWGDTVNVASRMESSGEPGRIHVSETFANVLNSEMAKQRKSETDVIPSDSEEPFPIPYSLFPRGEMEIKGKGLMTTYWLDASR